jgi:hypothetical protein
VITADLFRSRLDRMMTEADWQQQVAQFARLHRWLVFHARPAQTSRGWRTPVQHDGAGFPALTLVRTGQTPIFVELLSERGSLTRQQADWVRALEAASARVFCWKPSDWDEVVGTLS